MMIIISNIIIVILLYIISIVRILKCGGVPGGHLLERDLMFSPYMGVCLLWT